MQLLRREAGVQRRLVRERRGRNVQSSSVRDLAARSSSARCAADSKKQIEIAFPLGARQARARRSRGRKSRGRGPSCPSRAARASRPGTARRRAVVSTAIGRSVSASAPRHERLLASGRDVFSQALRACADRSSTSASYCAVGDPHQTAGRLLDVGLPDSLGGDRLADRGRRTSGRWPRAETGAGKTGAISAENAGSEPTTMASNDRRLSRCRRAARGARGSAPAPATTPASRRCCPAVRTGAPGSRRARHRDESRRRSSVRTAEAAHADRATARLLVRTLTCHPRRVCSTARSVNFRALTTSLGIARSR